MPLLPLFSYAPLRHFFPENPWFRPSYPKDEHPTLWDSTRWCRTWLRWDGPRSTAAEDQNSETSGADIDDVFFFGRSFLVGLSVGGRYVGFDVFIYTWFVAKKLYMICCYFVFLASCLDFLSHRFLFSQMALVGVPFVYKKHHVLQIYLATCWQHRLWQPPSAGTDGPGIGKTVHRGKGSSAEGTGGFGKLLGRFQLPADLEQKLGEFYGIFSFITWKFNVNPLKTAC